MSDALRAALLNLANAAVDRAFLKSVEIVSTVEREGALEEAAKVADQRAGQYKPDPGAIRSAYSNGQYEAARDIAYDIRALKSPPSSGGWLEENKKLDRLVRIADAGFRAGDGSAFRKAYNEHLTERALRSSPPKLPSPPSVNEGSDYALTRSVADLGWRIIELERS